MRIRRIKECKVKSIAEIELNVFAIKSIMCVCNYSFHIQLNKWVHVAIVTLKVMQKKKIGKSKEKERNTRSIHMLQSAITHLFLMGCKIVNLVMISGCWESL